MKRVAWIAAAVGVLVAVSTTAAAAATSNASFQVTPIGRLHFPDRAYVVDLPRTARLDPSVVRVRENGQPVDDLRLMPAREATSAKFGFVLAIDASDSMRGRPYRAAIAAARTFADRQTARELVGVVAFNNRSDVLVRPTADRAALHRALGHPVRLQNGTHIYDAMQTAIGLLDAANVGSGVIVLLSDGSDTGSKAGAPQVVAHARADHVRIFTVGLHSRDFAAPPLRQLASSTDATFSEAHSSQQLDAIYQGLGTKLASEYLLAYRSRVASHTRVRVEFAIEGFGTSELSYRAGVAPAFGPYHRSLATRFWESPLSLVFVALVAMAVVGGSLVLFLRRRPTMTIDRIARYVSVGKPEEEPRRALLTERLVSSTESSLGRTEWWGRFEEELEIAGINIVPGQIVVATAIGTLLVAIVLALIWFPLILAAIAVPLGVRALIKQKLHRVRESFLEQLPDNLQVLASALRAGHSFTGALAVVAKDAPEPARREFQRVVADDQLGVPVEDSLREVARRMDSDDFEQVALLAELQREAGGNMAEVLDTVVETVRERFDLRRLVQTLTAQGRLARWILTLLPVLLAGVISLLNPGYMQPLFHTSGGRVALFLAAVMVTSGSLVIKRIVNIKV